MIAIPILFMTVWVAIVGASAMISIKLDRLIRERWAVAHIPHRGLKKLRYIFGEATRDRFKADAELWRLRQTLGVLLVSTLVVWLCGVSAISGAGLVIVLMKH